MPWIDALAHCDALTFGGLDDWRSPTIDELRSLVRGCYSTETGGSCPWTDECTEDCGDFSCEGCEAMAGPGVDGCYWDAAFGGDCSVYWSSVTSPSVSTDAIYLSFQNGAAYVLEKTDSLYSRCVRDGI